jgi:uncharacterized protein YndB with AHSA1/START domain
MLAVAVAIVLIVAATKPDTLRVRRSITIDAPAEAIFAHINDFRRWEAWSPYEKLDPAMKRSYSGPASGPGAVYEWEGDGNVGKGRIEITDVSAPTRLALDLHMLEPMEGRNAVEFTLDPDGGATKVTWGMACPSPYLTKVISVFLDMDRMIGGQFEEGLANLKSLVEQERGGSVAESASRGSARDSAKR